MGILGLVSAKPRARRDRKFIPGNVGREDGHRLESRELTVPSFFRLGLLPEQLVSQVWGTNQPQVNQVTNTATLLYGNSVTQAMGQTNSTFTATSSINTLDGGLSGNPNAPTYRNVVQVLTYSLIDSQTPGFIPGVFNSMSTSEAWNREYLLADDDWLSRFTPCTMTEVFELKISPSQSPNYPTTNLLGGFGSGDKTIQNGQWNPTINFGLGGNGFLTVFSNVTANMNTQVQGGATLTYTANNATAAHPGSVVTVDNSVQNQVKMTIVTDFPNGLPLEVIA